MDEELGADEATTLAFREYLSALSERAPKVVMTLPGGASHTELKAIEATLGHALSASLRALYMQHNGEGRGERSRPMFKTRLFRHASLLPLRGDESVESALATTRQLGPWVPFASNGAGGWLGVVPDHAAQDAGAVVDYDAAEGERVAATSLEEYIRGFTRKVTRKRWEVSDAVLEVATAHIYASECIPMHQLVQHHALITQQLQLMRVPLTDEEHATLIAIENLGLEPSSDDLWCFVIQGVPHVSGAQLLWRDASGQAHYPSRSAYTVQRIRGRSQRRHTLSAPAEPLDELYLEISVEHDGSGTTTP